MTRALVIALGVLSSVGCAQVLGIEELQLASGDAGPDSSLHEDAGGTPTDAFVPRVDLGPIPDECGCPQPPCACIGCEDVALFGRPDGSFERVVLFMEQAYGSILPVGDFDGDGADDLFFRDSEGGASCVWYGRRGERSGFDPVPLTATPAIDPRVGDFDGDGRADVLLYGAADGNHGLFMGLRTRGFRMLGVTRPGMYEPLVGDFDGDGRSDVFWLGLVAESDEFVSWGEPDGSFLSEMATVLGLYQTSVGDFGGDGVDDFALYAPGTATDHLYQGGRDRRFVVERDAFSIDGEVRHVVADLDGDGADDLFQLGVGTGGGDFIRWSAIERTGVLPGPELEVDYNRFAAGDFDGDGRDEILLGAGGGSVVMSAGRDIASELSFTPLPIPDRVWPHVGDFDGDGLDDIYLHLR